MKTISELYREHVEELQRLASCGDEFATKSLACLALVCEGWRYGDPDPEDDGPDDDGGETVVHLDDWRMRIAA
jgi:hypothetical protein